MASYGLARGVSLLGLMVVTALAIAVIATVALGDPSTAIVPALNGVLLVAVLEALHRSRQRERTARLAERQSERRFRQVFDASPVALSVSDLESGRIVEVNDAYLRTFGVRRSEIIDHTPVEAGIETEPGAREAAFETLRSRGSVETAYDVTLEDGVRNVLLWSRVIDLDGQRCALSTFIDVTAERKARAAAHASDERLRELAETVHELFWVTDPLNREMLYVSPAYETIFGRSCADLYKDPRDWLLAIHPEDRERMRATLDEIRDTAWEDQYRITRPDGTERTIHVAVTPIRDATGRVVRVAGVGEDVTDKIALEAQVRETQKLKSLGLLAGGIAHDFNNILAVVAANASILAEYVSGEADSLELVREIEVAVQRATSMTRQLLAFSRKQVIEPVVLDLNAAIGDTRKMLRRMVGEDISISTSLEPELGHVLIDPGYLVQVLMNLAVNARDAMPRGGSLTISTRTLKDRKEVLLTVADTGCGMSSEVKARIFEPFFTTKDVGRGTGLGLSVVHGIIEQAGGRLEVDSEVGIGTTMKIFLPFVDAPAERISDVAVAGATGTEQILLVDDDMYVRAATSRTLRARGYRVLEASDGHAALRLLHDHADVALLVTDVVMPGLDGRELVDAARAGRPALKVLYISGYTDDAILRHGIKTAEVAILEKPFKAHSLAGKVRQILDAA